MSNNPPLNPSNIRKQRKDAVKANARKELERIEKEDLANFLILAMPQVNAIRALADESDLSYPKAYAALYPAFREDAAATTQANPVNTTGTATEVQPG